MRKKNELIIADSGAIFSLALLNQLDLLTKLFEDIKIPVAVWEEITLKKNTPYYQKIYRISTPNQTN